MVGTPAQRANMSRVAMGMIDDHPLMQGTEAQLVPTTSSGMSGQGLKAKYGHAPNSDVADAIDRKRGRNAAEAAFAGEVPNFTPT
jgi:hypothetical protein